MAASFTKYQNAIGKLLNNGGPTNFGTDTQKLGLTNTGPTATEPTNFGYVGASYPAGELATSNGYTAGGTALGSPGCTGTTGTWSVAGTPGAPTWTSTTGSMGPFEYIFIYDSTSATFKTIWGWWDYGSALTLAGANGDTFAVTFSTTNVPMTFA